MHPLNPLFFVIILAIAVATAHVLQLRYKITSVGGRYEAIDGLRGFLALSVFICHASIWHQFLQINHWTVPKSNLYTQLGQASVAFFFMITSFLFVGKLLNTTQQSFDWRGFFISRFYRIAPMYYVSIGFLILCALVATQFKLQVGFLVFFRSLFDWGIFALTHQSKVNDFQHTTIINAGVVWSLPFEWLFYFSLPIFAFLLRKRPPIVSVLVGVAVIVGYIYLHRYLHFSYILSFVAGAFAAYLVKFRSNFKMHPILANSIILASLFAIVQFPTADDHFCKLFIAIAFILIAYGHNLFGILHHKSVKFLGEVCYSTYLVHGLILFVTFYFGIGIEKAKYLSPTEYCGIIFLITPLVVVFSFLGYRYIEKPFMDYAKKINNAAKAKQI